MAVFPYQRVAGRLSLQLSCVRISWRPSWATVREVESVFVSVYRYELLLGYCCPFWWCSAILFPFRDVISLDVNDDVDDTIPVASVGDVLPADVEVSDFATADSDDA